jgi:hypothetical protein
VDVQLGEPKGSVIGSGSGTSGRVLAMLGGGCCRGPRTRTARAAGVAGSRSRRRAGGSAEPGNRSTTYCSPVSHGLDVAGHQDRLAGAAAGMETFGEGSPGAGGIQVVVGFGDRVAGEDRGRGRGAGDQQVVGKLAEAAALRTGGVRPGGRPRGRGRPCSVSSAPCRRTRRLGRATSRPGGRARPDRGPAGPTPSSTITTRTPSRSAAYRRTRATYPSTCSIPRCREAAA